MTFLGSNIRRDVSLAADPRFWAPNDTDATVSESIRVPADLPAGTYDIAISLPDASSTLRDDPKYAIRFANVGTWDPSEGTNVLGTIQVTNSRVPPPPPPPSTTTTTLAGGTTTTTTLPGASSVQLDTASVRSNCAGGAADTLTIPSITVGNQSNRILVLGVGAEDDTGDCDLALSQASVTYGGRTLTRAVSKVSDTDTWRACNGIFYLLNPPSGTANAVVTFANNATGMIDNRHAGAFVLYGAAQAAPASTASTGADATTNPVATSINVSNAGTLVVDVVTQGEAGSFTTQAAGQTERWDTACTSSGSAGSTMLVGAPATVQPGWRHTLPRRYAHSVAAFKPAP